VLSNINFSIPAGSIALVKGLSGSGKTTLIDLILGLKNPTSGVILFDGQKGVYPSQSYMAQDTILIDASLEENIALGEIPLEIDSTRVNSVVDLLGIDTFLKQGTSTLLHGSGDNLSGGQRQKIGLARCLYDNPLLLVLDEPTSSLDKESIEQISRVISSQRHQMTIIIVTHSADFDEISDVTLNL
jgi:ABC-type bacteriocin/lantibiotic exporter with double-glycine peptidase domain